jgi:hypothetical protein
MRVKRDLSFAKKHLFHVEKLKLSGVVLLERVQLTSRDLVPLDRVLLRKEGAHVLHKGARDNGR